MEGASLPFAWSGVRLHREGAGALRACVVASGRDTVSVAALDEVGAPLLSVGSLLGRPVDASQLASARARGSEEALYAVRWAQLDLPAPGASERCALLGDVDVPGVEAERHEDLRALCAAIEGGCARARGGVARRPGVEEPRCRAGRPRAGGAP